MIRDDCDILRHDLVSETHFLVKEFTQMFGSGTTNVQIQQIPAVFLLSQT